MWRDAFMNDPEFIGHFEDVVFAFENPEGSSSSSSSKSSASKGKSSGSKSSSTSSSSSSNSTASDLDTFRRVFKPSNIHGVFQE